MFRVLSDEEAQKAIRWKAPTINALEENIIQAKSPVSPLPISALQAQSDALIKAAKASHDKTSMGASPAVSHGTQTQEVIQSLSPDRASVSLVQSSYDDGHAQGYAEGLKALKNKQVAELTTLVSSLRRETAELEQGPLEKEVYALSIDIARVLLQREIELVPDTLAQLVKAGLEQLPSAAGGPRQVFLHPTDAEIVRKELGELPELALIVDDRLGRGECRLQSQDSTVHAGVENWLETMAVEFGLLSSSGSTEMESQSSESAVSR